MEPVRDQGRRPTCLAFAASATHRVAHDHPRELCPEWLYYHATRRDGLRPDQGSTIEATCAVIPAEGQPDEAFWPYQGQNPNPRPYQPPSGSPTVVRSNTGLRDGSPKRWRAELDAGRPVTIALLISRAFYTPVSFAESEAVMGDDAEPIDPALVHAVVLAGHGDIRSTPHFLIRNSWGLRWGWAGHAWFPESYLARRFASAFVIQHGASDHVSPDVACAHTRLRVG
jgi:hypothetical protein